MGGSKKSYLAFINYTQRDVTIECYGSDKFDWDGDILAPEQKFPRGTILKPFQRIERDLETADRASKYVDEYTVAWCRSCV